MSQVMTVTGPIAPEELGITMCHVHVLSDLQVSEQSKPISAMSLSELVLRNSPVTTEMLGMIRRHVNDVCCVDNNQLADIDLACEEVQHYHNANGRSVVETSIIGLGRNAAGLKRVSETTGVNIVCGTGWYISPSHSDFVKNASVEELTQFMIAELTQGIDGTEVKAGFVKAALSGPRPDVPFSGAEENVLRAAARAQGELGVAMTMHPCHHYGRARHWHTYLDIIEQEGGRLDKCYLSHMEFWHQDFEYQEALLARGVTLSFDQFGCEEYVRPGWSKAPDSARVQAILRLVEAGYVDRIVLSNEVVSKFRLRKYGGYGYSHLLDNIVPDLKYAGVSDAQIHTMLVENPQRLLPY